jgi:hypothetical protein
VPPSLVGDLETDAWEGFASARNALGDKGGALEAAERALALVSQSPPGQPKSRQRIQIEQKVATLKG